jgi:phospholipase C
VLGFLYADSGNVSPVTKQPFEGLTGQESNSDATGGAVPVSALAATTPNVYFTPRGVTRERASRPPTSNCSETPPRPTGVRPPTAASSPTSRQR